MTVHLLVRAAHVVVEATLASLLSGSLGCEATGAFITGARRGATDSVASTDSGPGAYNGSNATDSDSRNNTTDSRSYSTYSRSSSNAGSDWSNRSSNNALAKSWVNNAFA